MKLSIDSQKLADAVAWAARHVAARPAVPVLSGLRMHAAAGSLTLTGFDYDVSGTITVPCQVDDPGTVVLPARLLAEVTKALPKQPAELSLSGSEVTLTCGSAEFTLLTMPVEDYPTVPAAPDPTGTVDAELLRSAITQVTPAASKDDSLPMLTGVRLDVDGEAVTLAATDRYRLHVRDLTWDPAPDATVSIMVPGQILHDVARALTTGPVTVGISDKLIALTHGNRQTVSRLLDPEFPKYRAFFDADLPTWAEVDVKALAAAIGRVALMAERATPIMLEFSADDILVRAQASDLGRGAEPVAATLQGEPIAAAFQPHILLDALGAIHSERVRIGLQAPAKPTRMLPTEPDGLQLIVMPIRLSS